MRIQVKRKARGWSRRTLSQRLRFFGLDISPLTLRAWEEGVCEPTPRARRALESLFALPHGGTLDGMTARLPPTRTPLAREIRARRLEMGLSQAALARAAGIGATTINNIERIGTTPKPTTIRALESVLGRLEEVRHADD